MYIMKNDMPKKGKQFFCLLCLILLILKVKKKKKKNRVCSHTAF